MHCDSGKGEGYNEFLPTYSSDIMTPQQIMYKLDEESISETTWEYKHMFRRERSSFTCLTRLF